VGKVISREKVELGASAAPEGIEVARPRAIVNTNVEISYSPRKLTVRDKDRRWVAIVKREGRKLLVDVWVVNQDGELEEVAVKELGSPLELIGLEVPEEIKSGIGLALANWDKEVRRQEAQIALSDISVIPDRVTDREVLADQLAEIFIREYGAVAIVYRTSAGRSLGGVYCYEDGVYRICEEWLKTQAAKHLTSIQKFKLSRSLLEEVVEVRIPNRSHIEVDVRERKPMVAFLNGVLDFESFMVHGDLERALKPFDRSLFVTHKIPHHLNVELLKRGRKGLEKYIPPKDCVELLTVLSTLSPRAYELLRSWAWFNNVDPELLESRVCFLLEIIGRALFPGYSLFGTVVFKDLFALLGPSNTGKTTFLTKFLGERVLVDSSNWRVSSISSVTVRDAEEARRVFGSLYNVLAVFLPDISKDDRVETWSWVRTISGGDPIEARRLKENIFSYFPDYKFYLASNRPPPIKEEGEAKEALLNRLKVIEFKHRFPSAEINLSSLVKEEDLEAVLIASLYAIRLVYQRKGAYSNTGIRDVEDAWLRYSEPAYRLVMELVEIGRLKLDPGLRIYTGDLYNIVVDYARELARQEVESEGEEVESTVEGRVAKWLGADQSAFTKKVKKLLAKHGVKVARDSSGYYFVGLGVPRKALA